MLRFEFFMLVISLVLLCLQPSVVLAETDKELFVQFNPWPKELVVKEALRTGSTFKRSTFPGEKDLLVLVYQRIQDADYQVVVVKVMGKTASEVARVKVGGMGSLFTEIGFFDIDGDNRSEIFLSEVPQRNSMSTVLKFFGERLIPILGSEAHNSPVTVRGGLGESNFPEIADLNRDGVKELVSYASGRLEKKAKFIVYRFNPQVRFYQEWFSAICPEGTVTVTGEAAGCLAEKVPSK